MKAKSPVVSHNKSRFLTRLAFFLELSRRSEIEDTMRPASVITTKGRNQGETRPHNNGKGERLTARKERIEDKTAADLSPYSNAMVLIF